MIVDENENLALSLMEAIYEIISDDNNRKDLYAAVATILKDHDNGIEFYKCDQIDPILDRVLTKLGFVSNAEEEREDEISWDEDDDSDLDNDI
jgi:hypothetical protein